MNLKCLLFIIVICFTYFFLKTGDDRTVTVLFTPKAVREVNPRG